MEWQYESLDTKCAWDSKFNMFDLWKKTCFDNKYS